MTFSDDEGGQEKETNKNKISRTPTQTREQEKHSEKDSESVDREDRSSRVRIYHVKDERLCICR